MSGGRESDGVALMDGKGGGVVQVRIVNCGALYQKE